MDISWTNTEGDEMPLRDSPLKMDCSRHNLRETFGTLEAQMAGRKLIWIYSRQESREGFRGEIFAPIFDHSSQVATPRGNFGS
jgi:hypothetical protein